MLVKELKKLFPEDVGKLIKNWGSTYYASLFLLLATTGMRTQEARALVWGDVMWEEGIIFIERAVKESGEIGATKTGYEKATFLPDRTIIMLKRWKAESPYKENDHLIFFGPNEKEPLYKKLINIVLKERLTDLLPKLKDRTITPHCFRTTYNTYMRQNISENLLRLQLGHKSEAMTDRYDRGQLIDKLLPYQGEREKINDFWG